MADTASFAISKSEPKELIADIHVGPHVFEILSCGQGCHVLVEEDPSNFVEAGESERMELPGTR